MFTLKPFQVDIFTCGAVPKIVWCSKLQSSAWFFFSHDTFLLCYCSVAFVVLLLIKEYVQIGRMSEWKCLVPGGWSTLPSSCWGTLINSEYVHLKLSAYESPWQPWTRGSHCTKCLVPLEQDIFIRSYGAVEHNVIKRRKKKQVHVLIRHIFLWKWLELY